MVTKKMKGYKIRLYPTKEQEELFIKNIGACRYAWNCLIVLQNEMYESSGKLLTISEMKDHIDQFKQDGEHEWLNEVSNYSLDRVCKDLRRANNNFIGKKAEFPVLKRKKDDRQSYPVASEGTYFCDKSKVHIESIGDVKYKTDFEFPIGDGHKFYNIRVTFDDDKWFISFSMECEIKMPILNDKIMGIDIGAEYLAAVAFGDDRFTFKNINNSQEVRRLEDRLRYYQKSIARKHKTNERVGITEKSKNIERCEDEVREANRRLIGIRNNYIHQITHRLVSMRPSKVVIRAMNTIGMADHKYMEKTRYEEYYNEFIRQMRYKCEWSGIELIIADRKFASDRICSCCGNLKTDFNFRDDVYKCSVCGLNIDRDINSAINLSRYVPNSDVAN